jgi:hypothetical protein
MNNTSARSKVAKRSTLPLRMSTALNATSPNPTIRSSSSSNININNSNNHNFKYLLYAAVALGVQVLLIRSILVSLTLDDQDHHLLVEDLAMSLEFIHITKTGGTAIEVAGANVGIAWGLCHFERRKGMGAGCQRPNWASKKLQVRTTVLPDFHGELWHTPPTFFVNNPFQGKDTFAVVRNPYDRIVSEYYCPHYGYHRADGGDGGLKWRMQKAFMARAEQYRNFKKNDAAVGTDPSRPGFPSRHRHDGRHASSPPPPSNDPDGFRRWMERSVALRKQTKREELERYQEQQQRRQQQHQHHQPDSDSDTPIAVQQWMDQAISKQVEPEQPAQYRPDSKRRQPKRISKQRPPKHDTPESLNSWVIQQLYTINLNTGHMLPQHYYCFHQGSQVVTHILKYENLQDEFSLLMEQYNLTAVSLPVQNVNAGHAEKMGKKKLTKVDLFPETIRMINEYMAEDFELLGYDIMGV